MPDFTMADLLLAQPAGGAFGTQSPQEAAVTSVTPANVLTGAYKGFEDTARRMLEASGRQEIDPQAITQTMAMLYGANAPFVQPGALGAAGGGIKAYHGSPYDFEKFDLSKIGTGEGAQAYGHGLYFAENPKVAQEYRDSLSGRQIQGGAEGVAQSFLGTVGRDYAIKNLRDQVATNPQLKNFPQTAIEYQDAIKLLESGWEPPKGKMYEVNIDARPEQFLDWDKRIGEQPKPVFDALQKAWLAHPDLNQTGARIYDAAGMQSGMAGKDASHYATRTLEEAGIPGIKYLDQGSRNIPPLSPTIGGSAGLKITAKENPTSNYVVFNPEIIDIRKKWALLLAAMGGAGAPTMGSVLQSQDQ